MAHRETEQFRILFLDRKNVVIADEEQAKGTVDDVPVYPREVAKRALQLSASTVILVHNHPSGDPAPSAQDISITESVAAAFLAISVALDDHVIIGKTESPLSKLIVFCDFETWFKFRLQCTALFAVIASIDPSHP